MDARYVDQLARSLTIPDNRRGVLRVLVAMLLAGCLTALLDGLDALAAGRRKRRKKRRKHGRDRHRTRRQRRRCQSNSRARTCAGKCGVVRNNCRKRVDCGSCPAGESCDERTGQCVPDPAPGGCEAGSCVSCTALCPNGPPPHGCWCATNIDGNTSCIAPGVICPSSPVQCTSDADCEPGLFCLAAVFNQNNARKDCAIPPTSAVGLCTVFGPCGQV